MAQRRSASGELREELEIGRGWLSGDTRSCRDAGLPHGEGLGEVTGTGGEIGCGRRWPPRHRVVDPSLGNPTVSIRSAVELDIKDVPEFVSDHTVERGLGVGTPHKDLDASLSGVGECPEAITRSEKVDLPARKR